MSWRDRLRPAKLGSAAFLVDSADASIGRRTQVHEYPLRDLPFVEDLGRRARDIRIAAYVIGPDYMTARDALIMQVERPGPMRLVHPYLGELTVSVIDCLGPRESTREGGMAWFDLTVIESGAQQFPAAAMDTARDVAAKVKVATAASTATFSKQFTARGLPSFVSGAAADRVRALASKLRTVVGSVSTLTAPVSGFVSALSDLAGAASNLILLPQQLATTIVGIFEQLDDIVERPEFALDIVRSMFSFGDDFSSVSQTTPSRRQQATNQAALVSLVREVAAVSAARMTSQIDFVASTSTVYRTFEDVADLRDELVTVLDSSAETAADEVSYYALIDVRTALVVDLQSRAAPLARLLSVTLREPVPAVVLAYDLYDDALRDAEIIARNRLRQPNFVDPGRPLEVLSDV